MNTPFFVLRLWPTSCDIVHF